jgi:hypothetical protein
MSPDRFHWTCRNHYLDSLAFSWYNYLSFYSLLILHYLFIDDNCTYLEVVTEMAF